MFNARVIDAARRGCSPLAMLALLLSAGLAAPVHGDNLDATLDPAIVEALANGADSVEVIVETDGDPGGVAAGAELLGVEVTWIYRIIDAFAGLAPADSLELLALDPAVTHIHLDQPVGPVMDLSHRAIEADRAWDFGFRGAGVTVAVLDTGIDLLNPFFAGAIVECIAVIAGAISPECADLDGHGSHVAGTVASRDAQLPGVAPEASLAAVRVLQGPVGLTSDVIAGMQWVQENQDNVDPPIRVVNLSLGPLTPDCGDDSNPSAQAANNLVDSGVFVAAAAGNSGHDSCTIDGVGAASKAATIAAVDDRRTVTQDDDVIASFSSGGGGMLEKPDVSFPGVGITSAFIGGGTLIATMSGTSMATPHAAGTAALLLEQDPGRSPQELKSLITGRALKTENTGDTWNDVYGHGLGNACRALDLPACANPLEPVVLSADGFRDQGVHHADLLWDGADSDQVDIFRDGELVITTDNDGVHTDNIGTRGPAPDHVYQVCEAGRSRCSAPVEVVF